MTTKTLREPDYVRVVRGNLGEDAIEGQDFLTIPAYLQNSTFDARFLGKGADFEICDLVDGQFRPDLERTTIARERFIQHLPRITRSRKESKIFVRSPKSSGLWYDEFRENEPLELLSQEDYVASALAAKLYVSAAKIGTQKDFNDAKTREQIVPFKFPEVTSSRKVESHRLEFYLLRELHALGERSKI